jgi:KDO2-lipid IV(A) lauroyltransferase
MKRLSYVFLYGLLWLITRLPLRYLYFLSGLFYPILYYLIPYRKKLVLRNLRNAFPEWDRKKRLLTARKFYRHFCDSFVEGIVTVFMTEGEIKKRYHFRNPEVCNELYSKGKSIALIMGHYGNWEWAALMPEYVNHKILAIYKPLHNPYFDNLIKRNRERFGVETIAMEKIFKAMSRYIADGQPTLTMFLADQRPRWAQIQHWTTFLNQDTPVILGPEKMSKKLGLAVMFYKIIPVKRGYYEIEFVPMFDDPSATSTFEITERFHELLEETIRENPEYWLWTHNRWKHEKEKYVPKAIHYE